VGFTNCDCNNIDKILCTVSSKTLILLVLSLNCSPYGYVVVSIHIQASNLSLMPYGSFPCMCGVFCVKGDYGRCTAVRVYGKGAFVSVVNELLTQSKCT
jgi:hypothetical protein